MVLREFREAWRRLLKRPGYGALSVGVLGVGLGVVLFLFSLVNTLMISPLPFPHADRLVAIGWVTDDGIGIDDFASRQYLQLRTGLRSVDDTGAYTVAGVNLDQGDGATHYTGTRLTASMLGLLGVRPVLGRAFTTADDMPGATPVVLLGETLWRHAFHADPHIVGRAVRVNGEWATVVGVLPAKFGFPRDSALWLPLSLGSSPHLEMAGVARLAPLTTLGQARAELDAWAARMQRALPAGQTARRVTMKPLALSFVPEDMRHWVWLMFGAGVLVLLLACVNVANLQLVQTLRRHRELALRSALGCSRARLMLGALAESLLLSAAALLVAWPIVYFGNRWLTAMYVAASQPLYSFQQFGIHGWVFAFGAFAAVFSTALAGLVPAWLASRTDLQDALREGGKGSGGSFVRVAKALVVAEVALTIVLLVGSGMFVRSLHGLLSQPTAGATHAAQVLTGRVALPPAVYTNDEQRIRFFDTLTERLRQQPGVVSATAANTIPSAELGSHEDISAVGQPRPADGWLRAQMGIVGAHFLDTYDVRLVQGRFFDARDTAHSLPVTVIDPKTAAALWPGRDPLGQQLLLYPGKAWTTALTVVGVIEPLQLDSQLAKAVPGMLVPLAQAVGQPHLHDVGVAVRTHADAASFAPRLTQTVRSIDPQVAVFGVRSQLRDMAIGRIGLTVLTEVFTALGLAALLLAAAGLYGVLAFSVAQRTREIGIRRAIGAGNGAILRDAGRQLFWQLGLGLAIGTALALPWSQLLADPNLHSRAYDPAVFVPVLLLVIGVSALAALVPLLRALRVDPAVALRYE